MLNRRCVTLGITAVATLARPAMAFSSNTPVRWIVPFPPGGPVDAIARKLSDNVADAMGARISVENRAGANGSIGTHEVVRAAPDGRTFALAIPDSLISVTALLKDPPYDARRDLTLITQMVASPLVMMASADLGVGSIAELMARARQATVPISYGSWGPATTPHVLMTAIEAATTNRFTHVPYRGVAPALHDLAGRQVKLGFGPPHVAQRYAQKGLATPIALTGPVRSALLPDVPTFVEQGFIGAIEQSRIWVGLVGPKALPPSLVASWNVALGSAVRAPAFDRFLDAIGFVPIANSPAAFAKSLGAELVATRELVKRLGIGPTTKR